jgi:hypothetical protein
MVVEADSLAVVFDLLLIETMLRLASGTQPCPRTNLSSEKARLATGFLKRSVSLKAIQTLQSGL